MKEEAKILPESVVLTYDGSLEGYFSVVFRAYALNVEPLNIVDRSRSVQASIDETVHVDTETSQAQRVRKGLENRLGNKHFRLMHVAFLSNDAGKDMLLWRFIKKIFSDTSGKLYQNLLDEDVYDVFQCARKVRREVHRFHGFVRFQLSSEGMYFAPIDPDNDITMLLAPHFKSRYADQEWVIYDVGRKYGIWFDKRKIHRIVINEPAFALTSGHIRKQARAVDEDYYSTLWQHYYDAVNILERQNHRQMKAFMPKRYWKYLPEKNAR